MWSTQGNVGVGEVLEFEHQMNYYLNRYPTMRNALQKLLHMTKLFSFWYCYRPVHHANIDLIRYVLPYISKNLSFPVWTPEYYLLIDRRWFRQCHASWSNIRSPTHLDLSVTNPPACDLFLIYLQLLQRSKATLCPNVTVWEEALRPNNRSLATIWNLKLHRIWLYLNYICMQSINVTYSC